MPPHGGGVPLSSAVTSAGWGGGVGAVGAPSWHGTREIPESGGGASGAMSPIKTTPWQAGTAAKGIKRMTFGKWGGRGRWRQATTRAVPGQGCIGKPGGGGRSTLPTTAPRKKKNSLSATDAEEQFWRPRKYGTAEAGVGPTPTHHPQGVRVFL